MLKGIGKCFLILSLTVIVTGCKLAVGVGEGGYVESLSGANDCTENSVCEITVTDATFSDSFTAQPKPGYAFQVWAEGTDYLCAASADPTCVVSNVGLAGNAAAEAVIASDKVFRIAPLFTRIPPPRYVVRDNNGDIVGDAFDIIDGDRQADVRLTYTDENGIGHGYLLRFGRDYSRAVESAGTGFIGSDVRWDSPDCLGDPAYVKRNEVFTSMKPFASEELAVVQISSNTMPPPWKLHLAKLLPSTVQLARYRWSGDTCVHAQSDLLTPIEIIQHNLQDTFVAPFTLNVE